MEPIKNKSVGPQGQQAGKKKSLNQFVLPFMFLTTFPKSVSIPQSDKVVSKRNYSPDTG